LEKSKDCESSSLCSSFLEGGSEVVPRRVFESRVPPEFAKFAGEFADFAE
jgi:hypothetical protein